VQLLLGQQSRLILFLAEFPSHITTPQKRRLLRQMRQLDHNLPDLLTAPSPFAINSLVVKIDAPRPSFRQEERIRKMADLAMVLNRHPQLGFCLRRSLVRCYFLRLEGLRVVVHFGAQIIKGKPDREITGHAWLTMDKKPYFESAENWRDFTIIAAFPQEA